MSEGAGRVIAGTARGTNLVAPGAGTRPLGDRVKQAVFAILEPDLRGRSMLDLFAGSGAGGIEALSRGARAATFVEKDRGAVATIEANLAKTHFSPPAALVVRADVVAWLVAAARESVAVGHGHRPFGVVLVDPPYDRPDLLLASLERLAEGGAILDRGAVVVAKYGWRDPPPDRIGLLGSERARRFGETALTFYRAGPREEQA